MKPWPLLIALIGSLLLVSTQALSQDQTQPDQTAEQSAKEAERIAWVTAGLGLVDDALREGQGIHLPENVIYLKMGAANLLWDHDEKRARILYQEAAAALVELGSAPLSSTPAGQQRYYSFSQWRGELIRSIAPHDADLAYSVLLSTSGLSKSSHRGRQNPNEDQILESYIASTGFSRDPTRALQIAEASLKRGVSQNVVGMINQIRGNDNAAAAKLADSVYQKLQTEDLLKDWESVTAAIGFLNLIKPVQVDPRVTNGPNGPPAILSEESYRSLLLRLIDSAVTYPQSMASRDGNSRNAAQYLVNQLSSMQNEIQRYAPDRAVALRKVTTRVQQTDPYNQTWQRLQQTLQTEPIETALAAVDKAPADQRDNFYQQLAWRALNSGNEQQAVQIIREKVSDPSMREQFLQSLNQQAAQRALAEGKLGEARSKISQIADPMQRAMALINASQQISSKDATAAISLLDEARSGFPQQVEDEQQYSVLANIAMTYASQKSDKAFELLDPLADKLNDLTVAAQMMNGFGAYSFQDGEMLRGGGNLSNVIGQLSNALGAAGRMDTPRAKLLIAKLQRPELRSSVFLDLARSILQENLPINSRTIRLGTRSFAR
jgi:hypothetical protein